MIMRCKISTRSFCRWNVLNFLKSKPVYYLEGKKNWGARNTQSIFEYSCFMAGFLTPVGWGPVHTNPFSNENGGVLLGIRPSSTIPRRKRSPKSEPFENALQSGAIWKRCFLKTLFSSVDGENNAIWKRCRHQIDTPGRQTTRPWVSKMSGRHVASLLIGVVVWTGKNDTKTISVYANLLESGAKQLRFRLETD